MVLFKNIEEFQRFLDTSNTFTEVDNRIIDNQELLPITDIQVDTSVNGRFLCKITISGVHEFDFIAHRVDGKEWKFEFYDEREYLNIFKLTGLDFLAYFKAFHLCLRELFDTNDVQSIRFVFFNKMERIYFMLYDLKLFKFIMNEYDFTFSRKIKQGSITQISYVRGE